MRPYDWELDWDPAPAPARTESDDASSTLTRRPPGLLVMKILAGAGFVALGFAISVATVAGLVVLIFLARR